MKQWEEMRTALYVHKLGTVSAAAEALGVHRATIIRHIDALDAALGTPVFYRSSRGYIATESGLEALRIARQVDKLLDGIVGKTAAEARRLNERIIFSTLPAIVPLVMPAIRDFSASQTNTVIEIQGSKELARLDIGEAHVALRVGPKPTDAEYVVQRYCSFGFGLYAHPSYINRLGALTTLDEAHRHVFVAPPPEAKRRFTAWIDQYLPEGNIHVRTDGLDVGLEAVLLGVGIGVLPDWEGYLHKELVQLLPLPELFNENLWLVTHGSTHRTGSIQDFTRCLKSKRHPDLTID
ncbi:MAG: LysR family transcriptional regulator [Pseudomonadota bacterium]